MKKIRSIFLITVIVLIALLTAGGIQKDKSKPHTGDISLQGTWKLELYKYGTGTSEFKNRPENLKRIKLITDTHFIWITIDTATGRISEAAGGRYTVNGNAYTESIDYGYNMETYIGTKCTYNIKIEEDILFLSGDLGRFGKIEEIWRRIK